MRFAHKVMICGLGVALAMTGQGASGAMSAAGPDLPPLGQRVQFGAYVDGMIADPSKLLAFEKQLGRTTEVASYFYGFGDEFPAVTEQTFARGGTREVLLSWDMGPTRFIDWSTGVHDAYLRRIAAHARAYPYQVFVRPWPEMNGDWQDFQPTAAGTEKHGGTPAQFIAAWRHVVTTVRDAGGDNIKWVFNPTADTYPETTDVRIIWPGAEYVDVLGLDGYNWGVGGPFRWRSFAEIFHVQYTRLTALHPSAPVWICEFGSKEPAIDDGAPVDPTHSKAAWVRTALASTAFPRITTLVAFQVRKERDWRVDSSAAALAQLQRGLA